MTRKPPKIAKNESQPAPLNDAAPSRPCPICGKPAVAEARPFCSKRCADIDLHRWLGGTYAIPAEEKDLDQTDLDDEA
jgi:endogenous inhibitor of DNA gyrase (YacG/DUF329 family)